MADIVVVLRVFVPRQFEQGIEVVLLGSILRSMGVHATQFLEFLLKDSLHLLAPILLLRLLKHGVGLLLIGVAQFLLNSLHLTVQKIFALLTVNILFGLILDILAHLQHLDLVIEDFEQGEGTLLDGVNLQK